MSDAPIAGPSTPATRSLSSISGTSQTLLGGDWPVKAADAVERLVDTIRSKTTGPAIVASRLLVYGLVAIVLALIAAVLLLTLLVRLFVSICQGQVWLADLVMGGLFSFAGLMLWRRRTA